VTVDSDARLELVLSEALRALGHQQAMLDNIRSRATLLTTAAALVTSFLGAPAIASRHHDWPTVVAVIALAGVLVCTFVICAPWYRWRFRSSASILLGALDDGHDLNSMRRNLAGNFEQWHDGNERRIRVLEWWFTAGLVLLLIELLSWGLQLGRR
jgi:hypothetical protein